MHISTIYTVFAGVDRAPPPKIGKNMIFWRKCAPPNLKSWIRPWFVSLSLSQWVKVNKELMFKLSLFDIWECFILILLNYDDELSLNLVHIWTNAYSWFLDNNKTTPDKINTDLTFTTYVRLDIPQFLFLILPVALPADWVILNVLVLRTDFNVLW